MIVLDKILEFLFGKKFYINVLYFRGTQSCVVSGDIYSTYEEAMMAKQKQQMLTSIGYLTTVSFRSHQPITPMRYN